MSKVDATKTRFEGLLKTFIESTNTSMEAAHELAMLGLRHYAGPNQDGTGDDAGDLSYCQRFLEEMDKNYIRRQAYVDWLMAHAPVTMKKETFIKDKSDKASPWKVEVGCKVKFWEFAPAAPIGVPFGSNDVVVELNRAVNKFGKTNKEGEAKYKAEGHATEALAMAVKMIGELKANLEALNVKEPEAEPEKPSGVPGTLKLEADEITGDDDPKVVAA